jgi:hypothetical protein
MALLISLYGDMWLETRLFGRGSGATVAFNADLDIMRLTRDCTRPTR